MDVHHSSRMDMLTRERILNCGFNFLTEEHGVGMCCMQTILCERDFCKGNHHYQKKRTKCFCAGLLFLLSSYISLFAHILEGRHTDALPSIFVFSLHLYSHAMYPPPSLGLILFITSPA
jgi:hypothetical protein